MTFDEAINLLATDIRGVNPYSVDVEVWMDSTLIHIENIFSFSSTAAANFRNLRSELRVQKIMDKSPQLQTTFFLKARTQIEQLIKDLQRQKNAAHADQQIKAEEQGLRERELLMQIDAMKSLMNELKTRNQKLSDQLQGNENKPESNAIDNEPAWYKKVYEHWKTMKIQAWGILISASIALSFGLYKIGYDVGISKSDRDKVDFYQDNKTLREHLQLTKDTIRRLNNQVDVRDILIQRFYKTLSQKQRDSLNSLNR